MTLIITILLLSIDTTEEYVKKYDSDIGICEQKHNKPNNNRMEKSSNITYHGFIAVHYFYNVKKNPHQVPSSEFL